MADSPDTAPGPDGLARLAVQAGPNIGSELRIPAPVVTIGRGGPSEVVIDDDSVSTTHARLEWQPEHGGWRLMDLNSTNGTYVEGVRLAPEVPTPLPYGSTVRFGGVRMHFRPVEHADLDGARAAYTAPAAPERLADRTSGFRLPVWLVLLVLVVIALALAVFWLQEGAEPEAEPVPVEATAWVAPPADLAG